MVAILVVTPSKGFGELIQQVLEEAGNYAVVSASSGGEAVQLVKTEAPALCILDADLKDVPLPDLGDTLRDMQPGVLLVLIPPDDDPDEELPEMDADGYLSKPFYLPDLVSTVEEVLQGRKVEKKVVASDDPAETIQGGEAPAAKSFEGPAPEWLKDVDAAARHLARLTLESASQAALITQGSEIWAYAGELDQDAAEELASTVAHYWADDGGADLARYVRLDATGGDYMLYATDLGENFVLALAFDAEMPFSKIRSQANRLARDLAVTTLETSVDVMVAETQEQQLQTDAKETLEMPAIAEERDLSDIQFDTPAETDEDADMLPALDPFAPLEEEEEIGGDEPQAWEQLLAEPDTEPELPKVEEPVEEVVPDEAQEEAPLASEEMPLASEDFTADELQEMPFLDDASDSDLQPVTDPAGAYFEELEQTAEPVEAIEPLLDDVPPPIPEDWLPDEQPSEERKGFLEELITDTPPSSEQEEAAVLDLDSEEFDAELAAVLDEAFKEAEAAVEELEEEAETSSEETMPRDAPSSMEGAPLLEYDAEVTQVATPVSSDVDTLPHEFEPVFPSGTDDTIPASGFGQSRKQLTEFEGESPALVSLTYSCVLLPRLTEHHLTGELAAHLSELTTQLCVAFGWRLEQLSIRPDYLYWMVNVPPNTSPGYLMRIMRQHTSQRLFADFPSLAESNPSGDFWAPGYLILSGDDIPPPSLINDFIRQTRERQGLIGSR
ncbi:MAG: IS200/IS605 family transposase [Chloroflexi bacterium]|nr:MAG: IS200/IS605 family transposase [Chloroflexota bacterium]MBL1195679.1 IS200/IS605 family transposase [Chloroflexota bacterium]NOH12967.1 IS200/IS605 family transposase [Chloroflexota bacterium]